MAYAETTAVPFDKTVTDITALLRKAGADHIFQGESGGAFAIQCVLHDRVIRFKLPLLDPNSRRNEAHQRKVRIRALLLVIKAKLESIEAGVEAFDEAFLAQVVVDGETVHARMREPIAIEYKGGAKSSSAFAMLSPPRR